MLRALSLQTRMRIAGGVLLVCVAALGALTFSSLDQVNAQARVMDKVWTPRARAADEMGLAAREYRLSEAIRILSNSPEMVEQADADREANAQTFVEKAAAYRTLLPSGESRTSIDQVDQLWHDYLDGNERMLALARDGHGVEAALRFRNTASQFYLLANSLNELSKFNAQRASAASATAARISERAHFALVIAFLLVATIVCAVVVYLEFNVWRVLKRMSVLMRRIAAKEYDLIVLGADKRDEVGDMARAVEVFRLSGIEKQSLEVEAEAQRRKMEEARREYDETMTAQDAERRRAVETIGLGLERLSEGDMTYRLVDGFTPEFRKLRDDFNTAMDKVTTLVGEVQMSGIKVSTSMTEMAATSKQQQATAAEIAATTTEVGATSKEISATSKELLRAIHEVSTVAEQTANLAVNGQAGVSSMEETMRQVTEAASTINVKLGVLNEKAGNINQVVTTITKVADQTNLLSLNAAIEAEKAGEYGRGFAVVATEIRRLADQTGVATYDIEQMIKEIQSAISASVMGMDKFSEEVRRGMSDVQRVGGQLSEIVRQVQALVPHFELVSEGMQGQATGAEQISEALLQLTQAAQQTVESLQESTESISDLSQVTGALRSSVSRFKLSA